MDVSKAWTVKKAAIEVGIAPSTLRSAVVDGRVPSQKSACGLPMVLMPDVKKFLKKQHIPKPRKSAK